MCRVYVYGIGGRRDNRIGIQFLRQSSSENEQFDYKRKNIDEAGYSGTPVRRSFYPDVFNTVQMRDFDILPYFWLLFAQVSVRSGDYRNFMSLLYPLFR
jgi:hypothetical protein